MNLKVKYLTRITGHRVDMTCDDFIQVLKLFPIYKKGGSEGKSVLFSLLFYINMLANVVGDLKSIFVVCNNDA